MFSTPQLAVLFSALSVGFVGSAHCVGMCGPFAMLAGGRGGWRGVVVYSAGRSMTYAILGAFAGLLGAGLTVLREVGMVLAVLLVIAVALQLAGLLPEPRWAGRFATPLVRRVQRSHSGRFALGASTALLPCGLVYAALGVAVGGGHPAIGALAMIVFGFATWPALLIVGTGTGRWLQHRAKAQRVVALLVAIAGIYAIHHRAAPAMAAHASEQADTEVAAEEPLPECCRGYVSAPQ